MNSVSVSISFIFFENIIRTTHSDNNKMKCVASFGLFKNLDKHTRNTSVKNSKAKKELHNYWKMFALWISKYPRAQGLAEAKLSQVLGVLIVAELGLERTLERGETEQWLTPAWGEKTSSSAIGFLPLTDLMSTIPVLLQPLLCTQGKQFTWLLWDVENRNHGKTRKDEANSNRWFLILIMEMGFLTWYPKVNIFHT